MVADKIFGSGAREQQSLAYRGNAPPGQPAKAEYPR